MRIPKHNLPKAKNVKAAKRTAKHKPIKALMQPSATASVASMETDEHDEESAANAEEQAEETQNSNKCAPKTKEEKKAIRQARRKKNFASSHYKVRAGNVSSKHGPRAINRGSLC